MYRRLFPLAALVFCVALSAPAQADFKVGIAEQDAAMFDNKKFQALRIERVRYLVPFDWYKNAGQAAEVLGFMTRAEQADADLLVHFTARRGCYRNSRYSSSKSCRAPSVRKYRKAFNRFRREYPSVRTFGVWNEANHVSQPLARKPGLAARYFLAARKACRSCTLVAADVLDTSNMTSWVTKFMRKSGRKARIWGLHNYADVNRKRTAGTRALLRLVPGQVWATETGGLLKFLPSYRRSPSRQANRTKFMFKLFRAYDSRRSGMRSRLTRLYNYHWTGAKRKARFDAGLVNPNGKPRKAYKQFRKFARRYDR
jgi:hypothetical protein